MANETTDVLIIGTGFGGSIPGYYLAAGGARVIMLERGPRLASSEFTQSMASTHSARLCEWMPTCWPAVAPESRSECATRFARSSSCA